MPLIVLIAAFIDVAALPCEHAESVFLVVFILTFIRVAVLHVDLLAPPALSELHPVLEIAHIVAPVLPLVLSEAVWLPLLVLTSIDISVGKDVSTLTVLQAVGPLSFIPVAVFPLVDPVAIGLARSPLSNVRVAKDTLPDALALFQSSAPLSLVYLTVCPSVEAFSVGFVVGELAFILVAITVALHAAAIAGVTAPLPFVYTGFAVDHYSHAVAFAFGEFAPVHGIVVFLEAEVLALLEDFVVEDDRFHLVLFTDTDLFPDFRVYRLALFQFGHLFDLLEFQSGRLIHVLTIPKAT